MRFCFLRVSRELLVTDAPFLRVLHATRYRPSCSRCMKPLPFYSGGPRLLDRVRHAIRARHYSRRTEKAYVGWIKRYILFHGKRHPSDMGAAEVSRFLTALAVDRNVAASTQNQAMNALVFLYRVVLEHDLPWLDDVVRARRPQHLPVVFTRDEVRGRVLARLDGPRRLIALLLYGCGLRLLECLQLRVKDVDFPANQITIRSGKGARDRVTMLPAAAKPGLLEHIASVRRLGVAAGRAGAKVSSSSTRVRMAVGLPGHSPLHRPSHRTAPTTSSA
jgi:integrase